MRQEDMATPETDACAKRCRDNLPFALASQNPIESIGNVVTVAHATSLEQRLALAVAALKEIENSDDHGYVKLETVNSIAHRVLEQIEEGK
jgi:hypothetical protein